MTTWEVFRPADGIAQYRTRYRFVAWLLACFYHMDYALLGDGWCDQVRE